MKRTPVRPRPAAKEESSTATAITSQEQLLPFLLNPLSYPHRPRSVRLVQTHASFVFLTSPFVYKIKKPVNFGFLDFSTLEKRRHFCEREVALNRRLAPRVYLEVVPVSRRGGRYAWGPGGTVVEYAVKMRRLSARHFLDQVLGRGELRPEDLDRIAGLLTDFYLGQNPTEEIELWGRIDRLRISTEENFRQTEPFVGDPQVTRETSGDAKPPTISRPAFGALRSYTQDFYTRHAGLFASRIRDKWIRDCHGDLHLEHIHLTRRTVQIFDCIEFNDRFRYVDVASDVAFLAMDLDYEGRPDLARHFAGRMAAGLADAGLPLLLNFYKCYRAFVRGKVESLHSLAHAAPETERRAAADRARRYFQLALQYAVGGSQPLVLVVMGRIASGKSTLARALGAELGWEVLSSDYVRKKLAGFPLYERSSAAARTHLYSADATARTYDRLLTAAEHRLQQGLGVILDATFARPGQRELLSDRFARRGFTWRFVEAHASDATVKRRLRAREQSAREVSDARLEDFENLTRLYETPVGLPASQFVRVSTSGPIRKTLERTLRALVQN